MSIRPVDMQVLIPKATEISHATGLQNSAQQMGAQQAFKEVMDKHAEHELKHVKDADKSEHSVDKDGSNKDKERREKQKKRKEEEKQAGLNKKIYSTSMIDIEV